MKLTAKSVGALDLPPGKSDFIAWDDDIPGFGLRMRAGGARGYVFQYKVGAKQRRIALGAISAIDIGRARSVARDFYAKVRLGQDPAGAKAEARIAATETFAVIGRRYLDYQATRLRPGSYTEIARHLKYAAALHGMALTKIERRDVAGVILGVASTSGIVTGNRVRTTLSALFVWAMANGLTETNPVAGTARAGRERSRERVLSLSELHLIWRHLGDGHYASIMRLLMLTGQRAGEIANLRWSEIHGDTIVLPPERTKNGRTHVIPISTAVRAILDEQPLRTARDLIFGIGEGGFNGWHIAKKRLDSAIKAATGKALAPWTTHDVRRSVATGMASIAIQPHIIEAVLNHISGHRAGTAGIYNRCNYETEKAAALNKWSDVITEVARRES
jgi:integrase